VVLEVFSESWLRRSLLHQYRNPLFLRLALVSIQVGFHTVCLVIARCLRDDVCWRERILLAALVGHTA